MDLSLLGQLVEEILERNNIDHQPLTHVVALAEETGEACRAVLKSHQGLRGDKDYWHDQLTVELAQVVVCVSGCAAHMGIDLETAVTKELDRIGAMDWRVPREPS